MARPRKLTVDYFPHDADASDRKTLKILEAEFGAPGYAFWFKLLEELCRTPGHVFDCSVTGNLRFLQAKTGLSGVETTSILNLLAELQAIDFDLWKTKLVWSQNLVDRLADVYRNRRLEIPQKPVSTPDNPTKEDKTEVSTPDNPLGDVVSTPDNPQIKLNINKTKLNEMKEKESKEKFGEFQNVLLTAQELASVKQRFPDWQERIQRMSEAIASKGYKYKSHFAALLAWSRRDGGIQSPTVGVRRAPGWIPTEEERDEQERRFNQNGKL